MFLGYIPSSMPEATLDYIGQSGNVTNSLTTIDFGTKTIPFDSLVIVAYLGIGTGSVNVSRITIGGANATIHTSGGGSARKWAIGSLFTAAGSPDIQVVLTGSNGSGTSHGIGVWTLRAAASNTPRGANGVTNSGVSTLSISHNQVAPGYSVYAAMDGDSISSSTLSGSPIINYAAQDSNNRRFTYAQFKRAPTLTPYTETFTMTGSGNMILSGASWT